MALSRGENTHHSNYSQLWSGFQLNKRAKLDTQTVVDEYYSLLHLSCCCFRYLLMILRHKIHI